MDLREKLGSQLEDALGRIAGEDVFWDLGPTQRVGQTGAVETVALVTINMRGATLGQWNTWTMSVPYAPLITAEQAHVDDLVRQGVDALRSVRDQELGPPSKLIVPR